MQTNKSKKHAYPILRVFTLTLLLFLTLAFTAFGAVFINGVTRPSQIVINGTQGVGSGTNSHLIFLDTGLKFLNDTVQFFITAEGSNSIVNFTNVSIQFNRTAVFNRTFAYCTSCNSVSNYSGQTAFNISFRTNSLDDGNYTMNVSVFINNDDEYFNNSWYSLNDLYNRSLIIDNTVPSPAYSGGGGGMLADGSVIDASVINVSFTVGDGPDSNAYESTVKILFGNSTTLNLTTYPARTRSVNFSVPGQGNYTFNVTVNDSVAHTARTGSRSIVIDRTDPIGTLTASSGTTTTLSVVETMTCSHTDTNPGNVTLTRSDKVGNQCTGTSSCTASFTSDSYTSPTFTCKVYDKAGHTVTKTFTFDRIDPPSGTSSSSGGGGGGGGSSSSALGTIQAETATTTTINTEEVKEVSFTTNRRIDNAKVSVTTSTTKPASVPTAPEGLVFSYFEVNTVSFTNTDLKKSSIKFAVTKKWLEDNKLTTADITLYVFRDSAWKALKTTPASGDEKSEYFTADTEGFSTFAIVGQQKAAAAAAPAPSEEKTAEQAAAEEATAQAQAKKNILVWVVILLVVVALIVIFFVVKKRNM